MKNLLFVFAITLLSNTLLAQSGKNEFGVNASPFLKQLIRSESFPSNSDQSLLIEFGPYMMAYRHYGKSVNFRAGAGILIHDNPESDPRLLTETKRIHLDLRVGFEKMYALSEKWKVYYGLDAVLSHKEVYVQNVFDKQQVVENKTAFGGGPVFGIQYFFWKNLSLSTESAFYFLHFQSEDYTVVFLDNNFPIFNKSERSGLQGVFNVPLSLFLNYRF